MKQGLLLWTDSEIIRNSIVYGNTGEMQQIGWEADAQTVYLATTSNIEYACWEYS